MTDATLSGKKIWLVDKDRPESTLSMYLQDSEGALVTRVSDPAAVAELLAKGDRPDIVIVSAPASTTSTAEIESVIAAAEGKIPVFVLPGIKRPAPGMGSKKDAGTQFETLPSNLGGHDVHVLHSCSPFSVAEHIHERMVTKAPNPFALKELPMPISTTTARVASEAAHPKKEYHTPTPPLTTDFTGKRIWIADENAHSADTTKALFSNAEIQVFSSAERSPAHCRQSANFRTSLSPSGNTMEITRTGKVSFKRRWRSILPPSSPPTTKRWKSAISPMACES